MSKAAMVRAIASVSRLAFVAAAVWLFWQLLNRPGGALDQLWVTGLAKVALWVLPAVVLTWLVSARGWPASAHSLGVTPLAGTGSLLLLAAALPLAGAWLVEFRRWPSVDALAGDVLLGPFAEEILFRGFLFLGLRQLGWRFWPATVVSAAAFGAAHATFLPTLVSQTIWSLYVGAGVADLLPRWGTLLITVVQVGAGGVLFAWVCERWGSLWPAIALHMAMNFWWVMVYGPEGGPVQGLVALSPWTVASVVSFASVVGLTWRFAPRGPVAGRHDANPDWLADRADART